MSRNLHIVVLIDPHDAHLYVWRLMDMDQVVAFGRARLKHRAQKNAEDARDNGRTGDQGTDRE